MNSSNIQVARRAVQRSPSSFLRAVASRAFLATLLLVGAGLAHGAASEQGCGQAGCGSGVVDPAALRAALRGLDQAPGVGKPGAAGQSGMTGATPLASSPADAARAWERRFGGRADREDYNCALSFGVGGSVGGDGFLASRVMGRTKVLRGE